MTQGSPISPSALRASVDARTLERKAAVSQYTSIHSELLRAISAMAATSPDSTIVRRVLALAWFLEAKDRAGLERATLASAFAAGRITPELSERLLGLITEQQVYLDEFDRLASSVAQGWLVEAQAGWGQD